MAKKHINSEITFRNTHIKCTRWPLTQILTLVWVFQLGNRAKAPYASKVFTLEKFVYETNYLIILERISVLIYILPIRYTYDMYYEQF